MAVFNNRQQANAAVKERSISLFNNDLLSDVSLVVRASSDESDAKKRKMAIPAHKFVLSICSPVFFAMFCGKMAEKSDTIDLPDCEYEGVLEMLRYLYCEEIKLNECNVMQVFYVAKKYILPSLAGECVEFLHRNVDPSNVFCILSHAEQYDEKTLADRCWEVIDRETEEAVQSEGFTTIERSLLEATVIRDSLNVREVELFKAIDLWATKECERRGLATDGRVKRRMLGEKVVKAIRFPTMGDKEFASIVVDSNILNRAETRELTKHLNRASTTPVSFPEERRVGTCQSCCRFKTFSSVTHDRDEGWCYDDDDDETFYDAIKFWVDKDVELHGIRIFGSKGIEYRVSMRIIDWQYKETLLTTENEFFKSVPLPCKEEVIDGFDIMFDPLVLRKNNIYAVKAFIYGQESCFGIGDVDTVQCHGVTFHFKDYKSKRNDTYVHSGQFADFFFKPI